MRLARAQRQGRQDVPTSMAGVRAMLDEVRTRGAARVVDVLLPGIVGFCVPVFDADGHVALGLVALGPNGTFDAAWDGAVHKPMSLSLDELRGRPPVTSAVTFECAGNGRALLDPRPVSQPWMLEAVGTGSWSGTPRRSLREADRRQEADVRRFAVGQHVDVEPHAEAAG